jgi:hypothetical protein
LPRILPRESTQAYSRSVEAAEGVPLGYIEDVGEARTKLADFFIILPKPSLDNVPGPE